MTLKEIRELLASGDPIQVRSDEGDKRTWKTVNEDGFIGFVQDASYYRRKPKTKLRPWTTNEVPIGALVTWDGAGETLCIFEAGLERFFYRKSKLSGDIYCCYYSDAVTRIDNMRYSTDGGKTWLPCGVEEETSGTAY